MDLDRVDPVVFQELDKKESESILSDPHLYLCLIFMGIMLVMSLFACSHTEPLPEANTVKQEVGAAQKQ